MWKSKTFIIFFSVVVAVSILFLFYSWQTVRLYDRLLHGGIQTSGTIVEYTVRAGSKGYGKNHYLVFRFLDSQAILHQGQVVRNKLEIPFNPGQAIDIIYEPQDPSGNIPLFVIPDDIYQPIYSSLKFMAVALGVSFVFGAIVFSNFVRAWLR